MVVQYLCQQVRQYRLRRAQVLDATDFQPECVGNWTMWPGHIHAKSVVYGFGVGQSVKWDLAMIEQFGCKVHAFDPTPASIAWVVEQKLPPQFVFHDYGIAAFDGQLDFYPPRRASAGHFSQERRRGLVHWRQPVPGRVYRLATIMEMLGHRRIDVLKLDVEASEFEAIPDLIQSGIEIDQLLVEIHYQFRSRSFRSGLDLINKVKAHGMECIYVSERGYEFAFVRRGLMDSGAGSLRAATVLRGL
jgi:FkbM family methyltransferase